MATKCIDYNFHELEPHWQTYWEQNGSFRAENNSSKQVTLTLDPGAIGQYTVTLVVFDDRDQVSGAAADLVINVKQ